LSELIWNGFDASSHVVSVSFNYNGLDTLDSILVEDYGEGIPYRDVELYFGEIGDSWKKQKKIHIITHYMDKMEKDDLRLFV
jgi:sensor histidine kinase regulating citrate/malate metabolism